MLVCLQTKIAGKWANMMRGSDEVNIMQDMSS